jgi:4-hydroxy-tetrahydrodipicolinate synthase
LPRDTALDGIHFMLPTPFTADVEVNPGPFQRLVDCAVASGCTGVVTLGVMGESHRLSDTERSLVMNTVIKAADGRLKVLVGISSQSGRDVAERAREASAAGASAVMASPPRLAIPNDSAVKAYYSAIQDAVETPIVVQDLPEQTGVHMSPEFIAGLNQDLPSARYLKLEDPPTPQKVTRVVAATGGNMSVFGGLGGAFLFEELRRGGAGTMTGFAYPEVLVAIYRKMKAGDQEGARDVFYRWIPLIRYENSAGIGLSIRKHLMTKRGLLDAPHVRPPTPSIGQDTVEELDDLLASMDLDVSSL